MIVTKVSERLKPFLVSNGFVRRSPHYFRKIENVYQIFNFQCSQWGSGESGSFTVNLSVTTPTLFSGFTGKNFPKNPTSVSWPISERIGNLVDNRDTWWSINNSTEPELITDQLINSYIPKALKFFETYKTIELIEQALNKTKEYGVIPGIFPAQIPIALALIAYEHDNHHLASKYIETAYTESSGTPFVKTIDAVCNRLQNLKPNKSL